MNRVTAGETFSLTYDVASSGETYTARVIDAVGKRMDCTVSESSPNVTVSVDWQQWRNGQGGFGHVEIRREDTKAIVKRDRFRIMEGLRASELMTDYGTPA